MKTREANWQPQFMTCEGTRTGDREMWKEEVRNKLQEKFKGKPGQQEEKERRRRELEHAQKIERLEGETGQRIQFFDVLDGRAATDRDKAWDRAGMVTELIKNLTYMSCVRIHGMCDDHYRGITTEQSQQWNTTP